ncbi:MAG: hypothetical protein ACRBFS_03895 [Aureispira sp.]
MNKQHLICGLLIFGATVVSSFEVKEAPIWISLAVYVLFAIIAYFSDKGNIFFVILTTLYACFVMFTAGQSFLEKMFPIQEELYEIQGLSSIAYGAIGIGIVFSLFFAIACKEGLKKQEQLFYSCGIIACLLPSLLMN